MRLLSIKILKVIHPKKKKNRRKSEIINVTTHGNACSLVGALYIDGEDNIKFSMKTL